MKKMLLSRTIIFVLFITLLGCSPSNGTVPDAEQIVSEEKTSESFENEKVTNDSNDAGSDAEEANEIKESDGSDTKEDILEPDYDSNIDNAEDFDLGLKNVKIDTRNTDLTDDEKLAAQYFDDDYLSLPSYEMIRRYPKLFEGAEIEDWGRIGKVLRQDNDSFEAIYGIHYSTNDLADDWGYFSDKVAIIRGVTEDSYLMDNDFIYITGRMSGELETVTVDGHDVIAPVINIFKYVIWNGDEFEMEGLNEFSANDIKRIARTIFGDDTSIRESSVEEQHQVFAESPMYTPITAIPENQSNANFTKFMFYDGSIIDLSMISSWEDSIWRYVEFAPDFQHYLIYTYDYSLETLTLGYYDRDFQKIWKREFEETTNAMYDYTKKNFYMVANNSLYVIDMETGEDSYEPTFVGEKLDIRKVKDGIILIAKNKSDGIMKCGLDGKIIWSKNLPESNGMFYVRTQVLENGNLLLGYSADDGKYTQIYCLYDLNSGELLQQGSPIN